MLAIDHVPIEALTPDPSNARIHSRKQIRQIARSIEAFGFNVPTLIDADNRVIAGHGRLEALRLLGWSDVPVIRVSHLSPEQLTYAFFGKVAESLAGSPLYRASMSPRQRPSCTVEPIPTLRIGNHGADRGEPASAPTCLSPRPSPRIHLRRGHQCGHGGRPGRPQLRAG